ncbi:UbiH/UbiF/VisC/COQ6 family ubiquinone biosynthesis hydroxylase [Thioalkalivibrio sp. XN8]|uniref:UbiH/UbiF/VisC/COQ6 family ubiquinone biosynthesis hydroxylase n=1 Tax=Thioalkalivibrio sp. XN8 TaxID=2712863 RepID=UPI003211F06A
MKRGGEDIVVVGAGMVGAATAALLARAAPECNVVVLDAEPPPRWHAQDEPGLRVSALSEASRRVLESCGAWDEIAAARISPYRSMRVWDGEVPAGGPGAIRFDAADVAQPVLGHIVENELVRLALRNALQRLPNVRLLDGARLASLALDGEQAELGLEDGRRLRSRLVVGADGAGSASRALAGLEVHGHDYEQRAVVCNLRCQLPHGETAWQRFLPEGPIAFLPLADGRVSIVWSTSPERAAQLLELDDERFRAAVAEAGDGCLGEVLEAGPRAAFPLRMRHAPVYTRARYALVGDAAHTVHPLAGQGVNLGLLDAAALAQVVGAGLAAGRDPGDPALLRRYERWRKPENLLSMRAFDGINRLFSNDNPALGALRRAGLTMVDRLAPLKGVFIRRAMGLEGDLPAAARGGLAEA